ncbi:DNA repair protein RadC [Leptolyngbya sp. FACHB-60]|nr:MULTISPECIES: DNA repair protein RadC [Cyanophyceae]MBD1919467.1 DNA repair protein RadC [Phormidium sp. FACHB-77]MBD2054319.1 DNA repair protein RadC [Leptolyngbya sp. FACHB-60]
MALGERPRERLIHLGPKALSTAELLSILIGPGQGFPGPSSIEIAHAIIGAFHEGGGDAAADSGIDRLQRITFEELLHIPGVGPAKAAGIVAAIELGKRVFYRAPFPKTVVDDPAIAVAALTPYLMWEPREHFAVVCLNVRHQILATKVLTIGTDTETLAQPRDIFQAALKVGAARIIVAHNHPSESLEPSPEDMALTRQILEGAKIIGVSALDHLILGGGTYRSLRETTRLWLEEA